MHPLFGQLETGEPSCAPPVKICAPVRPRIFARTFRKILASIGSMRAFPGCGGAYPVDDQPSPDVRGASRDR